MEHVSFSLLAGNKDKKLRRKIRSFRRRKDEEHPDWKQEWDKGLRTYKQYGGFHPFNLPEPFNRRKAA
jgi:hypothetical protein